MSERRMTPDEARELRIEHGKRLRLAREAAGWPTITEAAEAAGIGRTVLSQLESGRSSPSMATLDRLIHTLGLDPRILFRGPAHRTRPRPPK